MIAGQREAFATIERWPLVARNMTIRTRRWTVNEILTTRDNCRIGISHDWRIRCIEAPLPPQFNCSPNHADERREKKDQADEHPSPPRARPTVMLIHRDCKL